MNRKDFCVTVSHSSYTIKYKGFPIGGAGQLVAAPMKEGIDSSRARMLNAQAGDREVNWLLQGEGCPLLRCHIEIIEAGLKEEQTA